MVPAVSLLELVAAVLECTASEAEAVATIAYMVNTRKVRLAGTFRDVRFDLRGMVPRHPGAPAAVSSTRRRGRNPLPQPI